MSKVYYVTKYALSNDGIIEELDCVCSARDPADVYEKGNAFGARRFRIGTDAFETRAEAEADMERRRLKKIASLKQQIAKLEKLAAPASSEKEG